MVEKVFYSYDDLKSDVLEIVNQIEKTSWRPQLILGVARGGLIPANYFSQWFDIPLFSYHYSLRDHTRTDIFDSGLITAIGGKKVLIVDDICDEGGTLYDIASKIEHVDCSPKFAVLHHNLGQDIFEPEFSGHEINKAEKNVWICYPWEKFWI